MLLKPFFSKLAPDERDAFAKRCKTSAAHIGNVMRGHRKCATDLAVLIERHSLGQVTREELRTDWADHWPELIGRNTKASRLGSSADHGQTPAAA